MATVEQLLTQQTHLLQQILARVNDLNSKADITLSQQDEVNADVAELTAAVTAIQAEIAALQAANPQLDLTALKAAVDSVAAIAPPAPTG